MTCQMMSWSGQRKLTAKPTMTISTNKSHRPRVQRNRERAAGLFPRREER
jgi:hypothetical protein